MLPILTAMLVKSTVLFLVNAKGKRNSHTAALKKTARYGIMKISKSFGVDVMKILLEIGNRYAANSDWKDFALTKFCLCAMGVLIGLHIPKRGKTVTSVIAGGVFAATYVLLMRKVFRIIREMSKAIDAA